MSPALVNRGRVNAFAEALDTRELTRRRAEEGTDRGAAQDNQADPAFAPFLSVVDVVQARSAAPPTPTADFRAALRTRLAEEAATLAVAEGGIPNQRSHRRATPAAPARPGSRGPWRRRFAVAGALVAVTGGGMGGVAVASTDALPGDMTYGVKRTVEKMQVSLAGSDRAKGEQYLEQARTRLGEAERLLGSGGGAPDQETVKHLRQVLGDLNQTAGKGRSLLTKDYESHHKVGPMQSLADFARSGTDRLDKIDRRLPAGVSGQRDQVRTLLGAIRDQVTPISGVKLNAPGQETPRGPAAPPSAATPSGPAANGLEQVLPGAPGTPNAPGGVPGVVGGVKPGASPVPTGGGTLPQLNVPLLGGSPTPDNAPGGAPKTPPPVGADVPPVVPGQPPVGVQVPPLLPGLPGIGLNLGEAPK